MCIRGRLKIKGCNNFVEAAPIANQINHLGNNKIDVYSPKENIKTNQLILKTQQRFKRETRIAFTAEINKIPSRSDNNKTMLLIDSIET